MSFVANFIRFPAVQNFWKSVKIWQSYRKFNGENFFETQCSCTGCPSAAVSSSNCTELCTVFVIKLRILMSDPPESRRTV